ncbi:hypothetical protein EJB05_32123 [Eragrostis curvula]|uniref:Uncharacterized protein n=1 Tax=Eragrostis curvula TaxID=38414 RepID=A0A5J9UFB6_9POAL|nr:hypothetical protein EJB05_32123 [Eragrostis curvula]
MARIKPKALLDKSKQKKGPSQIGVTTIVTYMVLGVLVASSVYFAYQYWVGRGSAAAAVGLRKTVNCIAEGMYSYLGAKKKVLYEE